MVKLGALALLLFTAAVNAQQKPNFIVILVDDLGFGDIGAYRDLYTGGDEKCLERESPQETFVIHVIGQGGGQHLV